jgi:hypothetical protein
VCVVIHDVTAFDLVDHFLVFIGEGTTAFVAFFDGSVKTSLFNVPFCNFQMLINVHNYTSLFLMGILAPVVGHWTADIPQIIFGGYMLYVNMSTLNRWTVGNSLSLVPASHPGEAGSLSVIVAVVVHRCDCGEQ